MPPGAGSSDTQYCAPGLARIGVTKGIGQCLDQKQCQWHRKIAGNLTPREIELEAQIAAFATRGVLDLSGNIFDQLPEADCSQIFVFVEDAVHQARAH